MSSSRDERIADYVLRLMDAAEAEAFELEMAGDPDCAKAVALAVEQFHELDATAAPIQPGAALWTGSENRLTRQPQPALALPRERGSLWRSLQFWRWAGLGGMATSAALAAALAAAVMRPVPAPRFIAVLEPEDRTAPGAIVEVDADGRARLIALQDIPVPAGRALEIWTLPSADRGPVSIGLMQRARSAGLSLENLPPAHADQLFEITLEPASGSPVGRPTGPILFKGFTARAL